MGACYSCNNCGKCHELSRQLAGHCPICRALLPSGVIICPSCGRPVPRKPGQAIADIGKQDVGKQVLQQHPVRLKLTE